MEGSNGGVQTVEASIDYMNHILIRGDQLTCAREPEDKRELYNSNRSSRGSNTSA